MIKKIATSFFVLLFSVLTANAQTKAQAPTAKKPVTKERIKQALHSKKAKQAFIKLKQNGRKEGE